MPRWFFPGLTALASLVLLVLLLLPLGVELAAERWLRANGAPAAEIDDVRIDPFRGRLQLVGLDGGSERADERLRLDDLSVDVDLGALFERRLRLERLHASGARIDVLRTPDGGLHLGPVVLPEPAQGEPSAPADEPAPAWGIGTDRIDMSDVELTLQASDDTLNLSIPRLHVGTHASWAPNELTDVDIDVVFEGAELEIRARARPWHGEPRLEGRLQLVGLSLPRLLELVPVETAVTLRDGRMDADIGLVGLLSADGAPELDFDGWVRLQRLALSTPIATGSTPGAADAAPGSRVALALDDAVLTLDGRVLTLDDGVGGGAESAPLRYRVDASLDLAGLNAKDADSDLELLDLRALKLEGASGSEAGRWTLGTLTAEGLRTLRLGDAREPDPVFAFDALRVEAATVEFPLDLQIDRVALEGPRLRVIRRADGGIAAVDETLALISGPETGSDAETGEDASAVSGDAPPADAPRDEGAESGATELPPIRIGTLRVTGDDWIAFEDRTLDPRQRFRFDDIELTVENFDTRGGAFPFDFVTREASGTSIALAGDATLGGTTPGVEATLDLERLFLTPLSPYVPGYNIERGQLSSKTRLSVAGTELDVVNDLSIDGLTLIGDRGGQQPLFERGMAMPLDAVLDLLRDGQDRIRFELPVTGRIDAPEFSTRGIVRLALQKALQRAAVSYLKNALQPLGTILLVGKLANKATRPRFEPVRLEPGSARIEGDALAYLEKVGTLLENRPRLKITVCGVSAEVDRVALAQTAAAAAANDAASPAAGTVAGTAAGTAAMDAPVSGGAVEGASSAATSAVDGEPEAAANVVSIGDEVLLDLAQDRTIAAVDLLTARPSVDRDRLYLCRAQLVDEADEEPPGIRITL